MVIKLIEKFKKEKKYEYIIKLITTIGLKLNSKITHNNLNKSLL